VSSGESGGAERGWKWWVSRVLTPLLVALIGGVAIVYATLHDPAEPQGTISSPADGATVTRAFTAEGTLEDIPEDRHVWLAVEVEGLLFPKEPEVSVEPHWLEQSVESGDPPGGTLSLVLLMVDESGQRQIENWLAHGRSSGEFAGLGEIADSTTLDAASQLVLTRGAAK
jgi:hypothetical protein